MAATLLKSAELWTMDESIQYLESGDVLVADGVIRQIGPTGTLTVSQDVHTIDLSGLILLPGLINCHTHLSLTNLKGLGNDLSLFPWLQKMGAAIAHQDSCDVNVATRAGLSELLRSGVTCLCDCGPNGPGVVAALGTERGLRTVSGFMVRSSWFGRSVVGNLAGDIAATEELLTYWSQRSGLPSFFLGAHSLYTASPDLLRNAKRASRTLGLDFNLHLAECAQETEYIRQQYGVSPVVHAERLGLLDEFTIVNHCVDITTDEMGLLADRGVRVVHCPASNAKLGSGTARVVEMRERGLLVGLGTDSAASNDDLNMFQEMRMAVLLQRAYYCDPSRFSALDALRMSTIDAARVLGMSDRIGSIEIGKLADLIAVETCLPVHQRGVAGLDALIFAADSTRVRMVMVDGKLLLDDVRSGGTSLVQAG
ncbi:MAG: amidohydrolase [Ardenticatenaceae bacterium]|nr:amidohydrolase [Ardenticatenaceae bacterium]